MSTQTKLTDSPALPVDVASWLMPTCETGTPAGAPPWNTLP